MVEAHANHNESTYSERKESAGRIAMIVTDCFGDAQHIAVQRSTEWSVQPHSLVGYVNHAGHVATPSEGLETKERVCLIVISCYLSRDSCSAHGGKLVNTSIFASASKMLCGRSHPRETDAMVCDHRLP